MANRVLTYQVDTNAEGRTTSVTPCPHGVRSFVSGKTAMVGSISCSAYCECFAGPIMRTDRRAILCGWPPKKKTLIQ